MRAPQFWVVVLLLIVTLGMLWRRGDVDRVPVSVPLQELSTSIDGLIGSDIPLEGYVLDVLGKGVFLNRVYSPIAPDVSHSPDQSASIGLFIAYFPTQRTGQAIHSPQNCLPGAGWTFDSQRVTTVTDESGRSYRVGDYIISNGKSRDEVLYWYRSHGRTIASDYAAKWDTLVDSILYDRSDAALIRVITPLSPGEPEAAAHKRVVDFAGHLAPMLSEYIPN